MRGYTATAQGSLSHSMHGTLQDSSLPFLCSICSQFKQTAVIKEMQEKIDSLTAEVIELRSNVTDLSASLHQVISVSATATGGEPTAPTATSWTAVGRRGKKTVNNAGSRQQTRAIQSQ